MKQRVQSKKKSSLHGSVAASCALLQSDRLAHITAGSDKSKLAECVLTSYAEEWDVRTVVD